MMRAPSTIPVAAVELAGDSIEMFDPEGRLIYVNPAFERLTGRSKDEVLGRMLADLHHDDEAFYDCIRRAISEGRTWRGDVVGRRKDGTPVWQEATCALVSEGTLVVGYVAIRRDITARREAARTLAASEERLREILESLNDAVFSTALSDSEPSYCNAAIEAIYGRPLDEFKRNPRLWFEAIHPEDRSRPEARRTGVVESGSWDSEHRILRPDGGVRWVHSRGRVVRDASGVALRINGLTTDITSRKDAARAVAASEDRLRGILESLHDAVFSTALSAAEPSYWSRAVEVVYGRPLDEFRRNPTLWLEAVHPEDRPEVEASLAGLLKTRSWVGDHRILRPDGEVRWVHSRWKLVRDSSGVPQAINAVVADITDRRRSSQEIERQRDELLRINEQKQYLTDLVVHDLKNPLASIIANAEFARDQSGVPAAVQEAMEDVLTASESMLQLVLNLLDISRAEDGELRLRRVEIDVRALLEEVCAVAYRRAASDAMKIVITAKPANHERLNADRDLLRRLVENLLDNCLKYTGRGGTIRLEASRSSDGWFEMSVSDEGPGIPEADRERIFEKYQQVRPGAIDQVSTSRGIGLAFCRVAVEAHGGRIWVEPGVPRGSVFRFRLPGGT